MRTCSQLHCLAENYVTEIGKFKFKINKFVFFNSFSMKIFFSIFFCFLFLNAFGQKDVDPTILTIETPILSEGSEAQVFSFKNNSFAVFHFEGEGLNKLYLHIFHYSGDFKLLNEVKFATTGFKLSEVRGPFWDQNNRIYFFGQNDSGGKKYYYDAVEQKFDEENLEWDANSSFELTYFSPYDKGWIACSQVFNPLVSIGLKRSKKVEGINIIDVVDNKVSIIPISVDGSEPKNTYCSALAYMKKSNVIVAQVSVKEDGKRNYSQHILIYDTNGNLLADHQYELEEGVGQFSTEIIEKSNMEFYMMGMSMTTRRDEFSMYKIHFTDKLIGELELDDATAIFDRSCTAEITNKGNAYMDTEDPALSKYSIHDPLYVKDGFYLIVEKAIPNIVLVVDPTTRTTSHKTKGYNYDFVYVLKYDLDANLQWQNCLEMSFDYKPKYFIDLVCVATDPLPNVKLGYIGVSFVTSKAFDASGEVVKSASSVDLFNANYRGSYTEDYQEQSRLIYLSGNTFLGCHYLRKSIELKKYEFE